MPLWPLRGPKHTPRIIYLWILSESLVQLCKGCGNIESFFDRSSMLAVLAVVHLICTCIQRVKPSPVGEACHLFVLSICLDISIMNSTPLKYPRTCFQTILCTANIATHLSSFCICVLINIFLISLIILLVVHFGLCIICLMISQDVLNHSLFLVLPLLVKKPFSLNLFSLYLNELCLLCTYLSSCSSESALSCNFYS